MNERDLSISPDFFDKTIDRAAANSLKWNHYADPDVIPLWVADMDFQSPPAVCRILADCAERGTYGYTLAGDQTAEAVCHWMHERHDWQIKPEWIVWLPGLVVGLNVVCRAVGNSGDAVVTTTPVYPPFLSAPGLSDRTLITVPHLQQKGESPEWVMDFDALEKAITPQTKLFLLCNPQNPTGRVYSEKELKQLGEICLKHDLWICSDEVHCDLVLDENCRHIPLATISPELAARTITLHSPSKTFNVPGLGMAYAICEDSAMRARLEKVKEGIVPYPNLFGYAGCCASFTHGEPWRQALLSYLRANRDLVLDAVGKMPGLSVSRPEATYLAWIDARELGQHDPAAFFEKAGVGLSGGGAFGDPEFVRLNFACPRALLQKALNRMSAALS